MVEQPHLTKNNSPHTPHHQKHKQPHSLKKGPHTSELRSLRVDVGGLPDDGLFWAGGGAVFCYYCYVLLGRG